MRLGEHATPVENTRLYRFPDFDRESKKGVLMLRFPLYRGSGDMSSAMIQITFTGDWVTSFPGCLLLEKDIRLSAKSVTSLFMISNWLYFNRQEKGLINGIMSDRNSSLFSENGMLIGFFIYDFVCCPIKYLF